MEMNGARFGTLVRLVVVTIFFPLIFSACRDDGNAEVKRALANANGSGNQAPSIAGTPGASVAAGKRYTFLPAANDPERAALGFSIRNRPAWAEFDTTTGRLTGMPTDAQVGKYADIVITASDGKTSVSLPAFAIEVLPAAAAATSGAATLSWLPPTENTDGSALNLGGFEILYGRNASVLDQTVRLSNPSVSVYVVENLSPGTWYFAIVAISATGTTSAPSPVASKTIS
jgi:Putative Ig domain